MWYSCFSSNLFQLPMALVDKLVQNVSSPLTFMQSELRQGILGLLTLTLGMCILFWDLATARALLTVCSDGADQKHWSKLPDLKRYWVSGRAFRVSDSCFWNLSTFSLMAWSDKAQIPPWKRQCVQLNVYWTVGHSGWGNVFYWTYLCWWKNRLSSYTELFFQVWERYSECHCYILGGADGSA